MLCAKNAERPLPLPDRLRTSPGNHAEIVADEPAPSHAHLTLELFPIALNDVTIHINLPWCCRRVIQRCAAAAVRFRITAVSALALSIAPAVETGNCATHSQ